MKNHYFLIKLHNLIGNSSHLITLLINQTSAHANKQSKKVCKTTAVRCYQCFGLGLLLFLVHRANWLKNQELQRSVVNRGGTAVKISPWRASNFFPISKVHSDDKHIIVTAVPLLLTTDRCIISSPTALVARKQ